MENYEEQELWSVQESPAARLEKNGVETLTDAELLALVIGGGIKHKEALETARQIIRKAGELKNIYRWDIKQFMQVKGIGRRKAMSLASMTEIHRRTMKGGDCRTAVINSRQVADVMKARIGNLSVEEFWVIYLNRSKKILETKRIAVGGISQVYVDPMVIFKEALLLYASGIVLCHNHPSGETKPSNADISLTESISKGAETLGIRVLDHVIVGEYGYYSFADCGRI